MLFQFAICWSPSILYHSLAPNVGLCFPCLQEVLEKLVEMILFHSQLVSHLTNTLFIACQSSASEIEGVVSLRRLYLGQGLLLDTLFCNTKFAWVQMWCMRSPKFPVYYCHQIYSLKLYRIVLSAKKKWVSKHINVSVWSQKKKIEVVIIVALISLHTTTLPLHGHFSGLMGNCLQFISCYYVNLPIH